MLARRVTTGHRVGPAPAEVSGALVRIRHPREWA